MLQPPRSPLLQRLQQLPRPGTQQVRKPFAHLLSAALGNKLLWAQSNSLVQ